MDSIRTLLLARTHTVVLDPDRVASAATRPTRDIDLEKFEYELVERGYVMSLDLAMTLRRLPFQAILELRTWISATLAAKPGARRPRVPLSHGDPAAPHAEVAAPYLRRVLTWLATRREQPCPWCGQVKLVGALDPCGHLVCRSCWDGGAYAGCPVCHRRIAVGDPFVRPAATAERVTDHDGALTLLHLGFDLIGSARARFEQLVGRASPLSPEDREELEVVIDAMGPKAVQWLPARIPLKETMAIALARLWMVAVDRGAMMGATRSRLATATDVLRVAVVLLGGNPGLIEPLRLGSIGRGMRRAVLEAIDQLPTDQAIEDMWRRRALWKRVGERLHPFEYAARLPVAALAFAAVRQTRLDTATFGAQVRDEARGVATIRIAGHRARVAPWAGAVEDQLRAGDARGAAERLGERPVELLRRVDHLVRIAQARQPDALAAVIGAVGVAAARAAPASLLALASHIAQRDAAWSRRVFLPAGEVTRAWGTPDRRARLRSDAIGALVALARAELVSRAAARRNFARAVLDRGLVDLRAPLAERAGVPPRTGWPRGTELALPSASDALRVFVHGEPSTATQGELELAVVLFDAAWRHVATLDRRHPAVGDGAAVHTVTAGPPSLGALAYVDLAVAPLRALGARHAMVVVRTGPIALGRPGYGVTGVAGAPRAGEVFDPRADALRFELHRGAVTKVALAIDLAADRVRWLDVDLRAREAMRAAGGYRAALAHIGRDLAELAAPGSRPTLWDVAAIHAAARVNIVYVRERSGAIATFRRRDHEQTLARLARLHAGDDADGTLDELPTANAPTWYAVLRDDVTLPPGSAGYVLAPRAAARGVERLSAAALVAELAR
jgi:hypothetical protein